MRGPDGKLTVGVFPAHAGMNRVTTLARKSRYGVFPAHAGMNRDLLRIRCGTEDVFPAHAGMNRRCTLSSIGLKCSPRMRG